MWLLTHDLGKVFRVPYRNCTSCNLSILVGDYFPALRHCPRCLGREGEEVPMFETDTLNRHALVVQRELEIQRPPAGTQ
jgi:hypothetical protein